MNTMNALAIGGLLTIASFVPGGCVSDAEKSEDARLNTVNTPLPHDPTDAFSIGPWWSDGKTLLNLRADGGYSIYRDNNRYTRPIDRGRWGQHSYATLWLEPYTGLAPQRVRVPITNVGGRIALQPPTYSNMFALETPPPMMEDRLLGEWRGSMGTLRLNADSTYAFVPSLGAMTSDGRVMTGHNGRWALGGKTLTLAPTTPSVSQQSLQLRQEAPTSESDTAPAPILQGLGGELVKLSTNAS